MIFIWLALVAATIIAVALARRVSRLEKQWLTLRSIIERESGYVNEHVHKDIAPHYANATRAMSRGLLSAMSQLEKDR